MTAAIWSMESQDFQSLKKPQCFKRISETDSRKMSAFQTAKHPVLFGSVTQSQVHRNAEAISCSSV